ncbi:putative protein kinase RLK-Pelle-LRR-I-1 family [Helianthus annuus]|nr:putative protein kinase RLK-Pelle-LRR-I-1 family [Helianthus annuus]
MESTTITKFAHLQIPLEDVQKATNNFHDDNIIGHGDFGRAYEGVLLRSDKLMKIAARRLDRKRGLGDVEFWKEVSVLSDLKHPNLVSIIGFCDEENEKIVVTTYEANGSLGQFLDSPNLTWTQRLRICVGVAQSLSYLHSAEGRDYIVIHRFINSSTILLDENWEAKLSGFEISMKQSVNRMDQALLSEPIGAMGYMDPTIGKTRGVTHKSDVYSFGVVLFEILCGRKAYIENEAYRFLASLVKCHLENNTLGAIVHPNLANDQMSLKSFNIYLRVALSCLEEEPAHRPDMDYIVVELKKALEAQMQRDNLEKNVGHLKICLTDIELATENFSEKYIIGDDEFGFYTFYKARLNHFDDEKSSSVEGKNNDERSKRENNVVIKRVNTRNDIGEERFLTEIKRLVNVKHPNIVTLLGFCVESYEMILVIDDVSNGFLGLYLGDNCSDVRRTLTWEKRLKICIDVANALDYIHSNMKDKKPMMHRDINADSIGLDENWGAKIVDFGFSAFERPYHLNDALPQRIVSRKKWYRAPEYQNTRTLRIKSDVYSFGVVLFEILCGRKANDPIYLKESDHGLAVVARRCFSRGTLYDMMDPILKEETHENNCVLYRGPNEYSIKTFIKIANRCLAKTLLERPTTKDVVKQLKKALSFQDGVQRPDIDQAANENIPEQVEHSSLQHIIDQFKEICQDLPKPEISWEKLEHLKIGLNDVKLATHDFAMECMISSSGYYSLYRAALSHFDEENPNIGAIKRISSGQDIYGKEEFHREIEMLTTIKHHAIATLLGYFAEGSEMILLINNVDNGLLSSYLGNENAHCSLTWEKRLKICIDVAHALNYLHSEIEDQKRIINRYISSSSIGLDENWGAKIIEFGFSIFLPPNHDDKGLYHGKPCGAEYFADPEYLRTGYLTRKSDVYSFGVVLLEMLCGRPAHDIIYFMDGHKGLAYVARQCFRMGTLENMIDPTIKEETSENNFVLNKGPNKDSLHTFMEIAYYCVDEVEHYRPTMKEVVEELEKALLLQKNNKDNPRISLEDIRLATQNFHVDNYIGRGGFGKVYKGNCQYGDRVEPVVAKQLDKQSDQGEQQFLSELQILMEYKHENVIGLVGYCDEQGEKVIVYEYASRRSLDRYLNAPYLTWMQRLNICIEVASALDFLHRGVGKQSKVVHRDIKTENILLNHDWKAKLGDFGLSLISPKSDYIIDSVCGTLGYLDPVYKKLKFLSIESDIYSFGVVLFEILCGRSTFVIHKHEGHYLPDFIKNKFEERKHDEVVFEPIKKQIEPRSLNTFQKIAYQCLRHERAQRPTAKEVLIQLKKALEFQVSYYSFRKVEFFMVTLICIRQKRFSW